MTDQLSPTSCKSGGNSDDILILSDDVVVESVDGDYLTLANLEMGSRVRVSSGLYEFLQQFREARAVSSLLSPGAVAKIKPQIDALRAKHIMLDPNAPLPNRQDKTRNPVALRFCNAPAFELNTLTDFTVFGLPSDFVGDCDARLAPEALRRKSLDYPFRSSVEGNKPCGWFDADIERWILEGARIADAGDVHIEYGEPQESLISRVEKVVSECCEANSIPVILGGDQTASAAVLEVLNKQREVQLGRLTGSGSWSDATSGTLLHLSIDLGIAESAYSSPNASEAALLSSITELKEQISAIVTAHQIVGVDLVNFDMRTSSSRLSAALGCQLALTAMDAVYAQR